MVDIKLSIWALLDYRTGTGIPACGYDDATSTMIVYYRRRTLLACLRGCLLRGFAVPPSLPHVPRVDLYGTDMSEAELQAAKDEIAKLRAEVERLKAGEVPADLWMRSGGKRVSSTSPPPHSATPSRFGARGCA